ncbi:MAG: KH domain-containing protein [Clostridia bacterium]|nr:KH domain-containing protein [Clostridia bacterium]
MLNLAEILADIARAIVDHPEDVVVSEEANGDDITLTLSVHADDMGMVIGRHGRIAKAIRSVMKAAATTCGKKVNVDIKD